MINRLLSRERRQRARALGAAIRLGCDFSGRNDQLLSRAALKIAADRLVLTPAPGWEDMLRGEQTAKRAQTLASNLRLQLEIA